MDGLSIGITAQERRKPTRVEMPEPGLESRRWAPPDLQVLVDLFYDEAAELGRFEQVTRDEMPEQDRGLLAHEAHMTVTLESFHRSLVDVEILSTVATATHYARKIRLRRQADRSVVMFGLIRLQRGSLPISVMSEIERGLEPLGRILIRSGILRDVKLLSLWRVDAGPDLRSSTERPGLGRCYGRTALIYCNDVPALELLEIVMPVDERAEGERGVEI